MTDKEQKKLFLEQLKKLTQSQLEELIFKLAIQESYLRKDTRVHTSIDIITILEQRTDDFAFLKKELDRITGGTLNQKFSLCSFDLTDLMTRCIEQLLPRRGFFVFTIMSCEDSDLFREAFCERLKNEFDKNKTNVSNHSLKLSPKLGSLDNAKSKIKLQKDNVKIGHYIFPIKIDSTDYNENNSVNNVIFNLYNDLVNEFQNSCNCLIIIIFISGTISVAETINITKLEGPKFTLSQIKEWLIQRSNDLALRQDILEQWVNKIDKESYNNNSYSIESLYDCLDMFIQSKGNIEELRTLKN